MTWRATTGTAGRWAGGLMRILLQEDVNFLLTNRLPRRLATQVVGRISRVEHPLVARPALALWRFFGGVDLSDARDTDFRSLRDGFTRQLRPDARPFATDPAILASPCDAIVGAHGRITDGHAFQIKGSPYRLDELLADPELAHRFRDGWFATLRLTAGMYHRFHAPADLHVDMVTHISGDCWNVNPIALKRVERLFCRNERVVIQGRLADGKPILLIAIAAILVAGVRLTFPPLVPRHPGSTRYPSDTSLRRGAEMGWFEHGSTIVVLLPAEAAATLLAVSDAEIRAGQPLAARELNGPDAPAPRAAPVPSPRNCPACPP